MKPTRNRIDWGDVKHRLARSQLALEEALTAEPERIASVFAKRAVALAKRQIESANDSEGFRVQVFSLGEQRYGIEISDLVEVVRWTKCTPVPGAPPEFLGVTNVRGEFRPVVDLARLLVLRESVNNADGFILIIRKNACEVGLRVDRIERLQRVRLQDTSMPAAGVTELSPRYVNGVTADNLILLSTAALLAHDIFQTEDQK